jgi:hypothetical protein
VADQKLLSIYLNDHLAGAIAGNELARRAAGNNRGTPEGDFLEGLAREIEEDRQTLEGLMADLGIRKDILKDSAAWLLEKAGRLKLNGRLLGYSPLSRVLELEGLSAGIQAKISLWQNLKQIPDPPAPLAQLDLDRLIERGQSQQTGLERYRLEAAADTFANGGR